MILEGANKLKEDINNSIYAINSTTAGQYCVVVPNNASGTYNMLIDLHKKHLYDEVSQGTKTKDSLLDELTNEYEKVKTQYPCGLLIIPMINEEEYLSAIKTLDKQKMFDETKKIGAITSELYKKLIDSGIEKQKIDQKIIMIQKQAEDEQYVNWLKEQMPGFVEGVSLEKKEEVKTNENPFMGTDIFGTTSQEVNNNENKEQTPTPVVTPTENITQNVTGGIFDSTPTTQEQPAPVNPIPTTNNNTSLFESPQENNPQPAPSIPEPVNTPVESPKEVQTPTPEEPKAIQNTALEGTTAFSPIPNTPQQPVENTQPEQTEEGRKKSGGFVNLAILLVVLIVVTIVSIELGKFLYSVYGA